MTGTDRIAVTRSSMPPYEEYCAEIRDLWDTHWLTNCGAKHNQLEEALREYLGVGHLSLFVNGHSALESVFEAMELGRDGRDEVITTPFTFASTTHAIVRKGLKPVFCDIKAADYTIDPALIEPLVTEKTCAIVPVHVYGNVCGVDAIDAVARKHDLKVVYDAAHAFGVKKEGVGIGSFGDASMFSFHATKVFNTVEGGAIACGDEELASRLARMRNFGISGPETVVCAGGNAKLNEFAAAMGICNLRHIDEELAKRKAVAERYRNNLGGIPGVKLVLPQEGVDGNYSYMPVVFDLEECGASRDDVFANLAEAGIDARKYFYPLASNLECYRGEFDSCETPIAKRVSESVLTLPLYADLALEDVDRICGILKECF